MRRPESFEILLPAEPAPRWVQALLMGVVAGHLAWWAGAWLQARADLDLIGPASVGAAVAVAVTAAVVGFAVSSRDDTAAAWVLRFDGEHWAWLRAEVAPAATGQGGDRRTLGRGTVGVALVVGPWWLLRARARQAGQSAWLVVRPARLGWPGQRLRTRLNWT